MVVAEWAWQEFRSVASKCGKLYITLLGKGGYRRVMRVSRRKKKLYRVRRDASATWRRQKPSGCHLDPLVRYDRHTK